MPSSTRSGSTLALSAAALATAAAGLASFAAVAPSSQLFGPVLIAPPRPRELALTFDDGPNRTATPYLLDLLALHNVRATFFLIGEYAQAERSLVRHIVDCGHTLGNHTMTHPRLPFCSPARIRAELLDAQHSTEDAAGTAVRLFRPPFGNRSPAVLQAAADLGLTTTTWNIIGNDWKLPSAELIGTRVARGVEQNRRRGFASNIVLHDGSQTTPRADRLRTIAATAFLLERFLAEDLHFVPLDAWLPTPPPTQA